jgi:hypothetical protein
LDLLDTLDVLALTFVDLFDHNLVWHLVFLLGGAALAYQKIDFRPLRVAPYLAAYSGLIFAKILFQFAWLVVATLIFPGMIAALVLADLATSALLGYWLLNLSGRRALSGFNTWRLAWVGIIPGPNVILWMAPNRDPILRSWGGYGWDAALIVTAMVNFSATYLAVQALYFS